MAKSAIVLPNLLSVLAKLRQEVKLATFGDKCFIVGRPRGYIFMKNAKINEFASFCCHGGDTERACGVVFAACL